MKVDLKEFIANSIKDNNVSRQMLIKAVLGDFGKLKSLMRRACSNDRDCNALYIIRKACDPMRADHCPLKGAWICLILLYESLKLLSNLQSIMNVITDRRFPRPLLQEFMLSTLISIKKLKYVITEGDAMPWSMVEMIFRRHGY